MDHVLVHPHNVRLMLDNLVVDHLLADRLNLHIRLVLLQAALILQNRRVRHLLIGLFGASDCFFRLGERRQNTAVRIRTALHALGLEKGQRWLINRLC